MNLTKKKIDSFLLCISFTLFCIKFIKYKCKYISWICSNAANICDEINPKQNTSSTHFFCYFFFLLLQLMKEIDKFSTACCSLLKQLMVLLHLKNCYTTKVQNLKPQHLKHFSRCMIHFGNIVL